MLSKTKLKIGECQVWIEIPDDATYYEAQSAARGVEIFLQHLLKDQMSFPVQPQPESKP